MPDFSTPPFEKEFVILNQPSTEPELPNDGIITLPPQQRQRAIALVLFAVVAVGMGQTVVFAILGPLGREVGLMELQIGAIITCSSIIFTLFSPIWGRASDSLGRKKVIIIGLVGYTLGTLLFASTFLAGLKGWLTGSALFAALIAARMCQSIVMSATSPSSTAYISDVTDITDRTASMGKIGAAHSIGTIVGPSLAGLAVFGLLAPLYFAACVTLLAAVLVVFYLPNLPARIKTGERSKKLSYLDSRILPFMIVGASMFTGFSIVQQTLGFYFQDVLQLDAGQTAKQVGIAMMGAALFALTSQIVVVQRFAWRPVVLMRVGLCSMFIGFLGLALVESFYWLVGAMCFVGAGMGMSMPGFSSAATLAVSAKEQGAVAGLIAACPAMGFIVGPVLGAGLYQVNQYAPYWFAALIFIPLIGFAMLSTKLK